MTDEQTTTAAPRRNGGDLAVAVGGEVVPRSAWATRALAAGDEVDRVGDQAASQSNRQPTGDLLVLRRRWQQHGRVADQLGQRLGCGGGSDKVQREVSLHCYSSC